jgi:uncharacterized protein YbbC (DUF1343 family)
MTDRSWISASDPSSHDATELPQKKVVEAIPATEKTVQSVRLGIDALAERGFDVLKDKRVGLLTHPAGVNRNGISTIQVLRSAERVHLVALFGPEHGIYGNEKANVSIGNVTDPRTGLPVFSLYGKTRKPTPEMLQNLDVLVIDLQDLGVRSYTYVSCMRYAMEACFENGIEVVVLDRPNPLGGLKVDGPPLEKEWMSYVGAFRVPYVHGLTIGELALLCKNQIGWMNIDDAARENGRLTVIPMQGWRRSMQWQDTGLRWVATSPAIPNISAAMGYSMTGLGTQLGDFRHGFGTRYPFRLLQYRGKTPDDILHAMKASNIAGLDFQIIHWKNENGEVNRGVYVVIKDWTSLRPTEISFWMMKIACQWSEESGKGNPFANASESDVQLFNKHVGISSWMDALRTQGSSVNVQRFVAEWSAKAQVFQDQTRKYWLYR